MSVAQVTIQLLDHSENRLERQPLLNIDKFVESRDSESAVYTNMLASVKRERKRSNHKETGGRCQVVRWLHAGVGMISVREKVVWRMGNRYPDIVNQASLCTLGEVTIRLMRTEKGEGTKNRKEKGIERGSNSRWQYCPATRTPELT